jgi:beta-glucosidase
MGQNGRTLPRKEKDMPSEPTYAFPQGFLWGTATASYQVEGAVNEGGRGPSIWDEFSHSPGRVYQGHTGDVACDHYHRFREDVALMKNLGVRAYRFSVAWPRVFPEGTGRPNEEGIAFYERLADALNDAGIEPWATLFHWDLPLALERRFGGWRSRETALAFADYAAFTARRLAGRIKGWFTVNEFGCFTNLGYGGFDKAPGLNVPRKELLRARHCAVLAHGLAVRAIRANDSTGAPVGLAENATIPVPAIETEGNIEAARRAMRRLNAPFLTAVMEGRYMDEYLAEEGENAPEVEEGDFDAIGEPLDFVGLNVYAPAYVRASDSPSGYEVLPMPRTYPTYRLGWLRFGPSVLYWAPRLVTELWGPRSNGQSPGAGRGTESGEPGAAGADGRAARFRAVYITENGACCDDVMTKEGEVLDLDRLVYLREHLIAAHRAVAEGYPLRGYFVWSLMDNFEWAEGYDKRFGLHYVNFETQARTPKLSAHWFAEVVRANRVV